MNILQIQTALLNKGFNPGDLDGAWGRRTMLAVRAFQKANGLEPDGVVGPLTIQALMGGAPGNAGGAGGGNLAPLVWYEEAKQLIGTREAARNANNIVILKWARDLNIDYDGDDIPWCGLFVAHCIAATLPDEQLPSGRLGARNWRRFGTPSTPMRGAVLVFWRGKPDGPNGHVGFYHSEDDSSYHVLGGNQSDQVNIARVAKSRFLAARWPSTASTLAGEIVHAEAEGPLSHRES